MQYDLTDLQTLKALLQKHDIEPSRSLGQNFLVCREVVEAVSMALGAAPQVTELGAGIGAITMELAAKGYQVRAIEKDDELAAMLPRIIPKALRSNIEVVHGDLRQEIWQWPSPYQIVGNIPYNLSGLVIRRLTQLEKEPTQALFLLQKEVGQRLTAHAPDMNLLSLAVQLWGNADVLLTVPPSCFWPQPEVHSCLVLLTPDPALGISITEREHILRVAKVFFQQKRKQIGGMLKKSFGLSIKEHDAILKKLHLSKEARPQELTRPVWQEMFYLLHSAGHIR